MGIDVEPKLKVNNEDIDEMMGVTWISKLGESF